MGNCNCDWAEEAFDKFEHFFESIGKWFENAFQTVWGDAKWAYYIAKDLLLIAGPFLGFFLYAMLTREETVITLAR